MLDNRKDISLEDYACLLARGYALAITGGYESLFGKNPFEKELNKEREAIWRFLDTVKIREGDVVARVRELIPETNWDNEIRKITDIAIDKLLDPNTPDAELKEMSSKLMMYLTEPDWREREQLEKLLNNDK